MTPAILFRVLLAAALVMLIAAIVNALWDTRAIDADPDDAVKVARGKAVYEQHCASCHGAQLEGQPNWRNRAASGRMPAPPHDASGHTWHHPDRVLFGITKEGLVAGKYAPPGYQSDMPGFGNVLSDTDVWSVLAYIKSTWPAHVRDYQRDLDRRAARDSTRE